jgi:hypothetical protein
VRRSQGQEGDDFQAGVSADHCGQEAALQTPLFLINQALHYAAGNESKAQLSAAGTNLVNDEEERME